MKERQANSAHTNKCLLWADIRRAQAKLKTSHFRKSGCKSSWSLSAAWSHWGPRKWKTGSHQTWAPRLKRLEGDKEQWNLVYHCNQERFFFFLLPHYFTTEAKKPNPTFGSDDKCTKWMLSPAGNTCQDYNKGWILSPHPHLPLHHLSHRGAGSPSAASAYSHTDTNINTHTQAKTHTCIDRKPVAKLGSCNYFTNDWALSGVTWSEKCVHVTAKERYCIKLYY